MLIWALVLVGIVFLDQLTKWLTVINLGLYESFPFIKDILHFTYIQNEGAAFGMFSEQRWVFMVISTVSIVVLSYMLWQYRKGSKLMCISLVFIIGGGIGNMIDRVLLGYVIDFVDVKFIPGWHYIFNVADSFVCVGVGLFILEMILEIVQELKNGKNKNNTDN